MKPAEVRRNDAVGPAATIPYSRCHSQARVVADPTKNHRHNQRSWHPTEEQRAARIEYESYETSFVIWNDFYSFLIQPVCCIYRIPLTEKPSSPCEESCDHVNSANRGITLACPYSLPRITFSILARIPSTAQRSMCELIFGKGKWDENWPFITSHKDIPVSIQNRLLSHVAWSCRTTRHCPFHVPAMLSAVPQSPSKSQADHEWPHTADLRTDLFVNKLLRPSPTPGRNRISLSVAKHGCKRDIVRDGAVATGVPHPLMRDGCSLGTVESPFATRRCQTPPGTASPDAVPQRRGCRNHSPSEAFSAIFKAGIVLNAEQNSSPVILWRWKPNRKELRFYSWDR